MPSRNRIGQPFVRRPMPRGGLAVGRSKILPLIVVNICLTYNIQTSYIKGLWRTGIHMSKPPIHPGQYLAEELKDIGVTPTELARQIGVPANRISEIIRGRRSITGDTALRLSHWFGATPQFWMNVQSAYDLRVAALRAGEAIGRLPRRGDGGADVRLVTRTTR